MGLEIEPNACLGMVRVNIGAGVLVTSRGAEEFNRCRRASSTSR